jgi:hypothetical protein
MNCVLQLFKAEMFFLVAVSVAILPPSGFHDFLRIILLAQGACQFITGVSLRGVALVCLAHGMLSVE